MKQTTNYNLVKPELTDSPPDITVMNSNWDKIDVKLKDNEEQIENLTDKVVWKPLDFKTESAKPSAYPDQQTTMFVATQVWSDVGNVIIKTEKYNNNIAIQYLLPNGNLITPLMYRLSTPNSDTWGEWKKNVDYKELEKRTIVTGKHLHVAYPSGISLNNVSNGKYDVTQWTNITDYPVGAYSYGTLIVNNSINNGLNLQMYIPDQTGEIYYRRGWNTNYGTWYKIATNAQPDWITATLQNGWTGTLQYRKNQIGQLEMRTNIDITISSTNTYGTIICTLPDGYRPVSSVPIVAYNNSRGKIVLALELFNDGKLFTRVVSADIPANIPAGEKLRINQIVALD